MTCNRAEDNLTNKRNDRERLLEEALQQELGDLGQQTASGKEQTSSTDASINRDTPNSQPVLAEQHPSAEQIVEPRIAYIINSVLKDVIRVGTGRRARVLGRTDLAGKTGTTNDQKDAWFSGFNQNIVATVWVGFDQPQTLGKREVGGYAALPGWIDFMSKALAGTAETELNRPDRLVSVRIDPNTGLLARPGQSDAIFEIFRQEHAPTQSSRISDSASNLEEEQEKIPEQLF
jgi:penicillin-binding protein 1A